MYLGKVTVEIDYRFDAGKCVECFGMTVAGINKNEVCARCYGTGEEPPTDKRLIARVRQSDADGFAFGRDLLEKAYIKNVAAAMRISRQQLASKNVIVDFVVSDRVRPV